MDASNVLNTMQVWGLPLLSPRRPLRADMLAATPLEQSVQKGISFVLHLTEGHQVSAAHFVKVGGLRQTSNPSVDMSPYPLVTLMHHWPASSQHELVLKKYI